MKPTNECAVCVLMTDRTEEGSEEIGRCIIGAVAHDV